MDFNRFQRSIFIRLIGICTTIISGVLLAFFVQNILGYAGAILLFIVAAQLFLKLYKFVTKTNQKLSRFIDSIEHSDFILKFSSDNDLDRNFKGLNASFNAILAAFRKERAAKEEHLQYLKTILQQINTGLIVVNSNGTIAMINERAKKIINLRKMGHIDELHKINSQLYKILKSSSADENFLLDLNDNAQLIIRSTSLKIKTKLVKIFTFHNIYSELQQKEIEAWQNLTKILRHEIMNSITPISSLNATLQDILEEDLVLTQDQFVLDQESVSDLKEGLTTIGNRTQGLIQFIDSYRNYSDLPAPNFQTINLMDVLENTHQLMHQEVSAQQIRFECNPLLPHLPIKGDAALLEMVLINLIKNAIQANENRPNAFIELIGGTDLKGVPFIMVKDNGKGIIPEAIDKIFIPFFTTKKVGTGIGLSLSKQIMQLHHGTLSVTSEEGKSTTFTMKFL